MKCIAYDFGSLGKYKYVVIFAKYNGKWIICKHRDRDTWETSGGHIEPGESPTDAAVRELKEETGALDFNIIPVCDYWAGKEIPEDVYASSANGQVFFANVRTMGELPESEMECVDFFDTYPDNLTYPEITEVLMEYLEKIL